MLGLFESCSASTVWTALTLASTARFFVNVTHAGLRLGEIQAYKGRIRAYTTQLLINEAGQPLTKNMLRGRFDAARDAAGIPKAHRGLRATAANTLDDDGGIRLEHTTERMAAQYIRHKVGKKVKPIR